MGAREANKRYQAKPEVKEARRKAQKARRATPDGKKLTRAYKVKYRAGERKAENARRATPSGREKMRIASQVHRDTRLGHAIIIRGAKSRAKQRRLAFDLPDDWKQDVAHCELSGLPFVKKDPMYAASIDRIDNSRGYTTDNCRLILRGLNVFKNKHNDATMLAVIQAVARQQHLC